MKQRRLEIGFIGLGRMGFAMVENLLDHKIRVFAHNRSPGPTRKLARKGAIPAFSIKELVSRMNSKPRVMWLMITAGKPTDDLINSLLPHLRKGDIVIDGSNSYYKDSMKRHVLFKKRGIKFLDCGVSGGISGARHGACMMVGGNRETFRKVEPFFKALCVKDGYGYMGSAGAGHFAKGIHNGIEYGMMSALNEGLEAIEKKKFGTDLKEVVKVYNNGSIIESKLTGWLYDSFTRPRYLSETSCGVPKGETEKEMKNLQKEFDLKILKQAISMRVASRKKGICGRFIAAMRNEFGGHKVKKKGQIS